MEEQSTQALIVNTYVIRPRFQLNGSESGISFQDDTKFMKIPLVPTFIFTTSRVCILI